MASMQLRGSKACNVLTLPVSVSLQQPTAETL